ncbi:hypothetical protein ACUOAQ_22860, partial [Escherichia sp. SP-MK]
IDIEDQQTNVLCFCYNVGDGVFMLTKEQLLAAREYFAIYKD